MSCFKPCRSGQGHCGEKGRSRHPDLRVRLCHASFRGGDIRTPLQKLRRHAKRNRHGRQPSEARAEWKTSKRAVRPAGRSHARTAPAQCRCSYPGPLSSSSCVSACATDSSEAMPVSNSTWSVAAIRGRPLPSNPAVASGHPRSEAQSNRRRVRHEPSTAYFQDQRRSLVPPPRPPAPVPHPAKKVRHPSGIEGKRVFGPSKAAAGRCRAGVTGAVPLRKIAANR